MRQIIFSVSISIHITLKTRIWCSLTYEGFYISLYFLFPAFLLPASYNQISVTTSSRYSACMYIMCLHKVCYCRGGHDEVLYCSKPYKNYFTTVSMVNTVSCCVDVPPRLFGVRGHSCLCDQMLNIFSTSAQDWRRRHKTEYHQMHPSSACVLQRVKPAGKRFNSTWSSERNLTGSWTCAPVCWRERGWRTGLWGLQHILSCMHISHGGLLMDKLSVRCHQTRLYL